MKCFAPWHSILVRFNGDIVPDGVYLKRYGNVLETPLNDLLNSYTASYTRDSIRSGVLPPECEQCALKEASVGHSPPFISRLPHDGCCTLLRQLRGGKFA